MTSSTDTIDTQSQLLSCIIHVEAEEECQKEKILPFKHSNWEALKEAASRRKVKTELQIIQIL